MCTSHDFERRRIPLLLGALLLLVPLTSQGKPLFGMPEDSLRARFHRIGFAPSVLAYRGERPAADARFESLLVHRLRTGGFDVIDPGIPIEAGRRMADSLGGLFDSRTGGLDSARADAVQKHVLRELQRAHGADAILYWRLVRVPAALSGGTARWDDVTEEMEKKGFLSKMMSPSYSGRVPALSIAIVVDDSTGRSCYASRVGIAVAGKLEKNKLVDRPSEEIFGDPKRNWDAVDGALTPFCEAVRGKK